MAPTPDLIPLDSPLRTYAKRGLPATMASTAPHGHLSGHPRTAAQQKAFDAHKTRILRTMSAEQIEGAYWDTVKKINTILEDDQKKKEEIQREIEKLTAQRDLERRIFKKQKEEKERRQAASMMMTTNAATAPGPTSAPMQTVEENESGKLDGDEVDKDKEKEKDLEKEMEMEKEEEKEEGKEKEQEKEKVVKEEVE